MNRKTRRYTEEFKEEAVKLALKTPNLEQTARGLGIPPGTLHMWLRNLKKKGTNQSVKSSDEKDLTMLLEENRRLHKELAIVKEEKEILKKADVSSMTH